MIIRNCLPSHPGNKSVPRNPGTVCVKLFVIETHAGITASTTCVTSRYNCRCALLLCNFRCCGNLSVFRCCTLCQEESPDSPCFRAFRAVCRCRVSVIFPEFLHHLLHPELPPKRRPTENPADLPFGSNKLRSSRFQCRRK